MSFDDKQYLLSQQSPPWMSSKKTIETPEWVDRDEIDHFAHMETRQPREHVIPINVEKSNISPMPFYGSSQPFNNVITPKTGKKIQNQHTFFIEFLRVIYLDPNANQFVNQGYNDIEFPQPTTQFNRPSYVQPKVQPQQQQQQPAGTRIIPIQIEGSQPSANVVMLQR
jgi:hypothetical protein